MSQNRIKCKCCDEITTEPCLYNGNESNCPEIMKVKVAVPSVQVHRGSITTGDHCCAFASQSWNHTVKMYNATCTGNCSWRSPLNTPKCVQDSHCGFPFETLNPSVGCYLGSEIWQGIDCGSTSERDEAFENCFAGVGIPTNCLCSDSSGSPCNSNGICAYGRQETYLRHTFTDRSGNVYCYFCGCCEDGHTSVCGQHPECDFCTECASCSNCGDQAEAVAWQGAVQSKIAANIGWVGGNINRFKLSIGLNATAAFIAQNCGCDGTWGAMMTDMPEPISGEGVNFCCNNTNGLDPWDTNANRLCGTDAGDCFCGTSGVCGFDGSEIEAWYLPEDITPENCTELIGVTQSTSGVQQIVSYTPWTATSDSCAYDALGVTSGRRYISKSVSFSPTWIIT